MDKPNLKTPKLFMSRVIFVVFCLLIQLIWLISIVWRLSSYYWIIGAILSLLSMVMVLWLVCRRDNPDYKLIWAIVILAVPIFGVLLYIFCGRSALTRKLGYKFDMIGQEFIGKLIQDEKVMEDFNRENQSIARIGHYIYNNSGYPIFDNTDTEYYPTGEAFFEGLKEELEKAEHFIFMEYFSIQEGYMWDSIVDILERKVKAGVEVRVMYDDMGCVALLPYNYREQMEKKGIQCRAFNPFIPILSVVMNHRDHRKITVIDGHTGFTGGANLTDQYINQIQSYGQWKDAAIMIKGVAVWNLTAMFLETWNAIKKTDISYENYTPKQTQAESFCAAGYVQPYSDTPLDQECVGENVYLQMIHRAKRYIYIFTPYLIIDDEMMSSLCLAAKSGIDVRIMTPHIPDKKIVFLLTQSYYSQLLDSGVRILEYTPGFLHSKCFICDDEMGCVSTINLDYRSLYLHFECGIFLYKTKSLVQIKEDFETTFLQGTEITKEFCDTRPWWVKISQSVLRLFAPLL